MIRSQIIVEIYPCETPSICKIQTSAPSMSNVDMDFGRPVVSAAWVHARSFIQASSSSLNVSGSIALPLLSTVLPDRSLHDFSLSKYFVSSSCCFLVSSTMNTTRSSSRLVLPIISVFSLESTTGACCLIPAR